MALNYSTALTSIFGADATLSGTGTDATLTFKPANTAITGTTFDSPENATPEGLLLSLLQFAFQSLGAASALPTSPIEISKTAILSIKDGAQVPGEQYVIRIFAGGGVSPLDPDNVRQPSSSSSAT
jgi:hypothetical protein